MAEPLTPEAERELAAVDAALDGRPVAPEHAALAELALLAREARPVLGADAARRLDARLERRAPGVRRRRRPQLGPWTLLPALGAVAALLLVVVVTQPGRQGGDEAGRVQTEEPGSHAESGDDAGGGGSGGEAATGTAPPAGAEIAPDSGASPRSDAMRRRRVERSATITLAARPRRLETVADGVVRVTDRAGGFVQSSRVSAGSGGSFTLRIPAARLQQALADLSRLAQRARALAADPEDITRSFVSARDRVADAGADRARLLRRLAAADTDAVARRLRAELRRVAPARGGPERSRPREQPRALRDDRRQLVADRSAARAGRRRGAGRPATRSATRRGCSRRPPRVALVALAVAVPLALVGVPLWLATRTGVRRRRERGLDAV